MTTTRDVAQIEDPYERMCVATMVALDLITRADFARSRGDLEAARAGELAVARLRGRIRALQLRLGILPPSREADR